MNLNRATTNDGTGIRIGEVRFSYPRLFEPNPENGKYSLCVLIDKTNKEALDLIDKAVDAAIQKGKDRLWKGKVPANLKKPLHDGDDERPDDEACFGMDYLNASNKYKPDVVYLEDGVLHEADERDLYPGCWGAVTLNFFAYDNSGNKGIGVSLGNVIKIREGERLASSAESAQSSFSDLCD